MKCTCQKCGMSVKGMVCGKCNAELVNDSIKTKSGETVQVAKCPKGCGMIKSPTCCAEDMTCTG